MLNRSQVQGRAGTALVPSKVSAPESAFAHSLTQTANRRLLPLVWNAVSIDWKLLLRAARSEGSGNLLVAILGGVISLNVSSSAIALGALLRTAARSLSMPATTILLFVAWAAAAAAFMSSWITGDVALTRRTAEALRVSGRRPADVLVVTLFRHLLGRHAVAVLIILVPVACFVGSWLPASRALLIATAMFVLLEACSSVAVVVSHLSARWRTALAVVPLLVVIGLLAAPLRQATTNGLAFLPPGLIPLLLMPSRVTVALASALIAAVFALVVGLEVILSMRPEASDDRGDDGAQMQIPTLSFRTARTPFTAVLVQESLHLLRWRRFLGFWILGTAVFLVFATKLRQGGPLLPVVGLSLLPSLFLSASFNNLFGADRGGYQCYSILPLPASAVISAKQAALSMFVLASLLIGWMSMLLAGALAMRASLLLYVICAASGFAVWVASVGRLTSVVLPRGIDPERIAGDGLSPTAALVTGISSGLYIVICGGAAMLYDFRRIGLVSLSIAGYAVVAGTLLLHFVTLRAATGLMTRRREEITQALVRR